MRMLLSFVLLLVIAGFNAYLAKRRGRDPVGWFLIGLLLGVFGLIVLMILPNKAGKAAEMEQDEDRLLAGAGQPEESFVNREWFYLDHDHVQKGPISFHLLIKAWEAQEISPDTYVWCEGMSQWERVSSLPLLQEALDPLQASLKYNP